MNSVKEKSSEALGGPYAAFARKLRESAKGFEERQILALVGQFME